MVDDAPLPPCRLLAVYVAGALPEVRIWSSQKGWVLAFECRDEVIATQIMQDFRYYIRSRKNVEEQWDAIRARAAEMARRVEGG